MNWKRAPELIEYLLMYPLIPPKLIKKLIYFENIFFWCNILPLGKSAVTLMPGLKLCLNLAATITDFKSFGSYSCNLMRQRLCESLTLPM